MTGDRISNFIALTIVIAVIAVIAWVASARGQESALSCLPSDLVAAEIKAEADALGGRVETIAAPAAIARYAAVVDEEPPPLGAADRLLILVHPQLQVAKVFPVRQELVCQWFLIGPELHRKAWRAARGDPA